MGIERTRARTRETPMRPPCPHQRDNEVTPRIGPHELDGMMPLAEPDLDAVGELPLKRLPASPVQANRTDRTLHRNTASLVERREARHAASVPRRDAQNHAKHSPLGVRFQMALAACATWHRAARSPLALRTGAWRLDRTPGRHPSSASKWHTRRVPLDPPRSTDRSRTPFDLDKKIARSKRVGDASDGRRCPQRLAERRTSSPAGEWRQAGAAAVIWVNTHFHWPSLSTKMSVVHSSASKCRPL